ncbi:hypothetical protein C7475_108173 [Chitinophaga sp. S165]|nr:hypothetical protein C7475_108173 [Chitinophaga sp. S165]
MLVSHANRAFQRDKYLINSNSYTGKWGEKTGNESRGNV